MMATNTLSSLVLSEILRNGFRVPDDFQVARFDRNSIYDINGQGIIFVRQPVDVFAEKAMELIMARIRSRANAEPAIEQIVLSPEIQE